MKKKSKRGIIPKSTKEHFDPDHDGFGFFIEVKEGLAHLDFIVREVVSVMETGESIPDKERYIEGSIKWDGCANLLFAEGNYLHLCGIFSAKSHSGLIDRLFEIASTRYSQEHPDIWQDR